VGADDSARFAITMPQPGPDRNWNRNRRAAWVGPDMGAYNCRGGPACKRGNS
jgi:hypothetical protein